MICSRDIVEKGLNMEKPVSKILFSHMQESLIYLLISTCLPPLSASTRWVLHNAYIIHNEWYEMQYNKYHKKNKTQSLTKTPSLNRILNI